MSQKRTLVWLGLLMLVVGIRWWDPLSRAPATEAVSAAVERPNRIPLAKAIVPPQAPASGPPAGSATWPVRAAQQQELEAGNAFLARGEVLAPEVKQVTKAPPAPVVAYVPPPPPPAPVEVPPALQVIGTWGDDANLAVFLSGPQGTVLARQGEVILAQYLVQSVTRQQLTLLQNSNQHVWNLAIPSAPSTLQTWPGR